MPMYANHSAESVKSAIVPQLSYESAAVNFSQPDTGSHSRVVSRAICSPVPGPVALTVSTSVIYRGLKADTESAHTDAFFTQHSGR